MPIQDSDLFLIEDTSGGSNKIEASKLKANLAANTYNDYLLLVNKSDYSACFVKSQNMQGSVEPTDYMMIERGGVSYSVTGQQIIDYFPSTPAGQAGPITESGVDNQLTLASDTNVSDFVNGDAINMVDVDGAVASYVPLTSTITNVDALPAGLDNVTPSGLKDASIDAILSAYGVTSITGFGLEDRGDSYTLELLAFKKDGVAVSTTATTTSGAPYIAATGNTFDWQTFLSPSRFRCQGFGTLAYACVISPQIPVAGSSFQVSCGAIGGALYVLDQNGNKVYVVGGEPKTSLTLTDGQDLKYFKPGDAVQPYGITYVASAPPTAAGDPFANAGDDFYVRTNAETTVTFTFPSPVDFSTIRKFRGGGYNQDEGYTVTFTDQLGNEVSGSGITVTGWSTTDLPVVPPNLVKTFSITGSTGYSFKGFYDASSIFVPTGTLGGSPIVISTDTTANTMTVDGGAWIGSDGSGSGIWNQSQVWSSNTSFAPSVTNAANLFNGSFSNGPYGSTNGSFTVTFNPPITGTKFEISDLQSAGFNPKYTVNGNEVNGVGVSNSPTSFNFTDISSIVGSGTLSTFTYSVVNTVGGGFTPSLNGIRVNGALLVDPQHAGAPTADTQVTGPTKSGTGNFNGNTGPVVDVTNSNGDWIDNKNRLGKDFYIKAASTRTGLAVLRAKAITQAQAWVASDNYVADQLVTYDGRYWIALASSYYNSPDSGDELEWFDLGAIEAIAINGYYPLYLTSDDADAASSSSSHHTHTFDGVDYYMPNGGTIYHGDYEG